MVTRRTIKRINPARRDVFDDQLWPVIVALGVLSAIGIGAIVTLLAGPWMWISLLLLPALTAGSLWLLSRMNDSTLRRTLQFSLITSLAGHLLILIIASLVSIFNNPYQPKQPQVSKRKVRTIQFSSRDNSTAIEVTKPDNTPEPEVEIERSETQVTTTEQPIPVPKTETTITPQTVRRESTRQTVPRFSESLSQLRRNEIVQPQPREIAVSRPTAAPQPSESKPTESVTASKQADQISRSSATSSNTNPTAKAAISVKPPTPQPRPQSAARRRTVSNQTRVRPSLLETNPAPKIASAPPSTAVARVERPESDMRNEPARSEPKPSKSSPALTKTVEAQPAESSGKLTRRPRQNEIASANNSPSPLTRKKAAVPLTSDIKRRETTPAKPSITSPLASSTSSRLATVDAPRVQSVTPANRPAPTPKSTASAAEVTAQTLSISKSESGTAGSGKKQNLQTADGGLPSPAVRPSDSAINPRSQSRKTAVPMLTNSQAATVRRATGPAAKPMSAFKAETSAIAKISGSKTPSLESLESSAAELDSASSREVADTSVEQGAAEVNLGPTKVFEETRRRELSGGGSPNVANLSPTTTRRSSAASAIRPSLDSSETGPTAAPRETASKPIDAEEIEPTVAADAIAKVDGNDSDDLSPSGAPDVAPAANQGFKMDPQLAAVRRESNQNNSRSSADQMLNNLLSGEGDDEEDDDEEERRRRQLGQGRVRVARAPTVSTDDPTSGAASGNNDASLASRESNSTADIDGGTESDRAELSQRSESAGSSSTADLLGSAATRLAVSAIANLPVAEGSVMRRGAKSESEMPNRRIAELANSQGTRPTESAPKVDLTAKLTGSPFSEKATANNDSVAQQTEVGDELSNPQLSRSTTESATDLQIDVAAMTGPVGLADQPDVDVGIATRPASEDSKQLQPSFDTRFRNPDFGGAPAMNPNATLAKEAFRRRSPGMAESPAEPKTEAAIHLGLEFLARYQQPDGSWSLMRFDTEHPLHKFQLDSDTAATGLAVLAFQGAGYNHREFKYARQINHAIEWLKANQAEDGLLYLDSDEKSNNAARLYSHGIAALALTEAYGMTQDPTLKEPAQRALDFIAETQHPTKGGWRYFSARKQLSTDTSVTGWMVMALQSGRLSGLDVKDKTFDAIMKWIDVAADPVNESLYRYNPYAVNSQGVSRIQGRNATPSMTAVGLLMRVYTGWKRDDPRLLSGARYLVQQQLPGETKQLRDTYYWYYATQVLKHVDGPEWQTWNDALRPLLIRTQEKSGDNAGSWDPYGPVPDRWGPFGGRLYVTTMNILSLEVRHRLLPLYIETNKNSAVPPDANLQPKEAVVIEGPIE